MSRPSFRIFARSSSPTWARSTRSRSSRVGASSRMRLTKPLQAACGESCSNARSISESGRASPRERDPNRYTRRSASAWAACATMAPTVRSKMGSLSVAAVAGMKHRTSGVRSRQGRGRARGTAGLVRGSALDIWRGPASRAIRRGSELGLRQVFGQAARRGTLRSSAPRLVLAASRARRWTRACGGGLGPRACSSARSRGGSSRRQRAATAESR